MLDVAEHCKRASRRGWRVVAVSDAYRLLPFADALYSCDARWWHVHDGCPNFAGEKWSSHGEGNDKLAVAERFGLRLVAGKDAEGFSFRDCIHYGSNSGFQAINLALLFGAVRVVLVGFDMRVTGKRHFFGDHPAGLLNAADYTRFVPAFEAAAKRLPAGIKIINATPGSALQCFETLPLESALGLESANDALPCAA